MIRFIEVNKKYKDSKLEVLKGINLDIEQGDFVNITGDKGKSTLLRFLYLLDKPTSGDVIYNGIYLNKIRNLRKASKIKRDIGYIDQSLNLLENRTVKQNIDLSLDLIKAKKSLKKSKLNELIEFFEIEDILDSKVYNISNEEKLLVCIVREFSKSPNLMIVDGVTKLLSPYNIQKLFNMLYKINDNGATVICVIDENIDFDGRVKNVIINGGIINV